MAPHFRSLRHGVLEKRSAEAEQMTKAMRDNGRQVWYLMAKDEGHGFAKKKNVDFQFLSTILFFREHLLK